MTATSSDNLQDTLSREFGEAVDVQAAQESDSVDSIQPQIVAAPRDEAAALALVSWCGRELVALVPRGGGTKIEIGARPGALQLLLSSRHLNSVFDHDTGNATVTAGAGITLSALDEVVNGDGQFVPLEYSVDAATLGGAVATNEAGATKLKYGTPRDLVVGLSAALSDGRLVQAGSKVVKNVSGYDLNKLFIGSFGTLGFLTRVTIRLRPRDETTAFWNAAMSSWAEAEGTGFEIVDGAYEPTSLRVVSVGEALYLQARFDGVEASVQAQIARLNSAGNATPALERENPAADHTVRLKAVLPLRRAAAWAVAAQNMGASGLQWDCGTGIVCAVFDDVPDIAVLRQLAVQSEGSMIVERAPHELKTPDLVWGAPGSHFMLMQRLKAKFDGARIFAPGRFVGGL
jgi:glycolate oxidase FAD binding subunit